ncbi:hypothetical protein [Oceanithermus sp.]|uniref:hypothetical protein n=1 Tax=Oceanithermus sp. TaxID=2268145 RepID=UPI0025EDD404|nr:hypothetical protein [Oceanithermus sp.]
MNWELRVWHLDSTTAVSYTNTAPGGIAGPLRWSVKGSGDCDQLRFSARPSLMPNVAAGDRVQLLIDGVPAFWGVLEVGWPADDSELREYVAAGGRELLKRRVIVSGKWARDTFPDVADIVRGIAQGSAMHPWLAYDAAKVRDTGRGVDMDVPGPVTVARVFDDLARAAGVKWGVDPTGTLFFNPATIATQVGYTESDLNWLPVQADDIVTKVIAYAGYKDIPDGQFVTLTTQGDTNTRELIGSRAVMSDVAYEAPEHAIYGAEKAVSVPVYFASKDAGDDPMPGSAIEQMGGITLETGGLAFCTLNGSASNLTDGNSSTYVELVVGDSGNVGSLYSATLRLTLPPGIWPQRIELDVSASEELQGPPSYPSANVKADAYIRSDLVKEQEARILGSSALVSYYGDTILERSVLFEVYIDPDAHKCSGTTLKLRVSEVRVWGWWAPDLAEIGKGYIHVPAQEPQEIELRGFKPATWTIEVTGVPDGDVVGDVDRWDYALEAEGMTSRARLAGGGTGEVARIIRLIADSARQQADNHTLRVTAVK